jgi:hypothetical protein
MNRKKNDDYVTRVECTQVSGQIRSELAILKRAMVGEDLTGGIVKDMGELKNDVKAIKQYINTEENKGRDWRLLGFSILGSTVTGAIVIFIRFFLGI